MSRRIKLTSTAVAAGLAAMLYGGVASADLVEYSFTGTDGSERTLPASATHANPTGSITYALSAGLDRRVRMSVIDSKGKTLSTKTSHTLGAADRITASGREYYGALLDLSAPGEGRYTLRSEILTASGEEVSKDENTVIFDTTPPEVGQDILRSGGFTLEVLHFNGYAESGKGDLYALQVSDETQLANAHFFAVDNDGEGERRTLPAKIQADQGRVSIVLGNGLKPVMPHEQHSYLIGFDVYDEAGNKTTVSRKSSLDNRVPPILMEVFDPNLNTWVPHVRNMLVHENPVRMRFVRKKEEHTDFNGSKYGWVGGFNTSDAHNVYTNVNVPVPAPNSGTVFKTYANGSVSTNYRNYPVQLAPGVEGAPQPLSIQYHVKFDSIRNNGSVLEAGWHSGSQFNVSAPVHVDRVRVHAEKRSYPQRVYMGNVYQDCVIQPGEDYCDMINESYVIESGKSYSPLQVRLSRHDTNTLNVAYTHLYRYWDFNAPAIQATSIDAQNAQLYMRVLDADRTNNWTSTMWDTKILDAYAVEIGTGKETKLARLSYADISYNTKEAYYSYRGLSDGEYRFKFVAIDTYGNRTEEISDLVMVDNTPPSLSITSSGSIGSLDDIDILLSDNLDPAPRVMSVNLKGGPATDDVWLSARQEEPGKYKLEYPVMFPSLEAGEEYTLTVMATDKQGNSASDSLVFSYTPEVTVLPGDDDGRVRIPSLAETFTTKSGRHAITSSPILLSDGTPVSGVYDMHATLRSDSPGKLYINETLIGPGDTLLLNEMSFTETGGRVILPVRSGQPGAEGDHSIIITSTAPNAPTLLANITTWMPKVSVHKRDDAPVQVLSDQKITISTGSQSACPITTSVSLARESDPLLAPVCLFEWQSIPRGLKAVSVEGSERPLTELQGRYLQSGPQKATYNIYVYHTNGSRSLIYQGEDVTEVTPITHSASFTHELDGRTVSRAVESVDITLLQTGSAPACKITTNQAEAHKNSTVGGPLTCLIEFTEVPGDLRVSQVSPPRIEGVMRSIGSHTISWVASIYDSEGTKLLMEEKTTSFEVVHPPVTSSLSFTVNESSSAQVSSTESHGNAWNQKTYSVISPADKGNVQVTAAGFKYTPQPGYVGPDTFDYRVTDSTGMYAEATANVSVLEYNYPPKIEDELFTAPRNEASTFALSVEDPNLWDSHTFDLVSQPKPAGIKTMIKNGQLVVEPVQHWYGNAELSYRATDSKGLRSEVATISVNIPLGVDGSAPKVTMTGETTCLAPSSLPAYSFSIEDFDAGVNQESVILQARFSDETLDVPFRLMNRSAVEKDLSLQVAPRLYEINADVRAGTKLEARLRTAYYDIEQYGGRLPFSLTLSASDMEGNRTVEEVDINPRVLGDNQAPDLKISVSDGATLKHINDLSVIVTDDLSGIHSEEIFANLSYAGETLPLIFSQAYSASSPSKDMCSSRHPLRVEYRSHQSSLVEEEALGLLTRAYAAGEALKLEVTASDYAGNETQKTLMIEFSPEPFVAGAVAVPPVKYQFRDEDGMPTVRIKAEDAVMSFGDSVGYTAVVLAQNGSSVAVNGKPMNLGQAVNLGQFSLLEGQYLSLDIRSDETGVGGSATVMLLPLSPAGRAIQIPVEVWQPEIKLTAKSWTPVQLFEEVSVRAGQVNSSACRLTSNPDAARYSDKIRDPLCLFTWDILPADTFTVAQDQPEMAGLIATPGRHLVAWSVTLLDEEGGSHVMTQGESMIEVRPASDVMGFNIDMNHDTPYRVISEVQGSLKQQAGPRCSVMTTSSELAYDMSARNLPACLVEWTYIPDGIEPQNWTDEPRFTGAFDIPEGDAEFEWSVSSFSPSGVKVDIGTYKQRVELLDPPSPTIDMARNTLIKDSLYRAPINGGLVGEYTVEALNSPVRVEVSEDGAVVETDEALGGFSQRLIYRGRIMASEKSLWTKTPVEIDARYSSFPSVNSQKGIEVLSVPDESLRPNLNLMGGEVLNTDGMTVETWVGHPYGDAPYSSDTMGEWEVRLLNHISTSNQEPLTEFAKINGEGKAVFDIDLMGLGTDFIRVMPEARLLSPVEEYERTALGARPLYVTILRGEAIDSSIHARRVKGEAPLRFMSKLDLETRLDYKALGDVIWELRSPEGGGWEPAESDSTISDRFQHTFDTGRYELRARVINKNSEAEFVTETVEIHAYNVPKISIEGPANAFIGSEAVLRLVATLGGEAIAADDMVVEWSEDNGETWNSAGTEYAVSRDEEVRVMMMVRVRMADAPDGWEDANVTKRHRVAFRPVGPPRGSILGSRVIEEGKEVEWRGSSRPPYPRMDVEIKGRFILPDGTVVDDSEVQYMPTRSDTDRDRNEIAYESWIVGFEDLGAISTVSRRVSVWQYKWPDWGMSVRMSANQAPAEISLRVRKPVGMGRYLEEVQYEWDIPTGVEMDEPRTDDGRTLHVSKPGTYPVAVRITDARGNFTELIEEITISPPEPWDVDFRISASNADLRAPLDVRLSPSVRGGHPRDRVSMYRYLLNDQVVSEGARYSSVELGAGRHELILEIESDFGETKRGKQFIEVQENTPPVCEMDAQESRNHWRLFAQCTDETGRVRRHIWTLNGEQLILSSSRISLSKKNGEVMEVQLYAIDDGGAESEVVTWIGGGAPSEE